MTIREIVSAIAEKNQKEGIILKGGASAAEIQFFEEKIGFQLPDEFSELYSICNGFECSEDIFNLLSLDDILNGRDDYGKGWFYFAEYMIFSDLWALRKKKNGLFEIYHPGVEEIVLTDSIKTFLLRFLQGNVFDKGGLYDWNEEKRKS